VIRVWLACGVILLFPRPARAQQDQSDVADMATRLATLTAVTGYERAMVDTLLRIVPGSTRDRAGNARLVLGGGPVKRLVACLLDEPGYVVGSVREDGYLTLRRVPGRVIPPLFDQQLEGQRVTVQGRRGAVPGVVAVRSIHLTRGRDTLSDAPFTVDNAYVDVGAHSAAGVTALGLGVLAPVTLAKRPHFYGRGLMAAPAAGRRAACAALVLAVKQSAVRAKLLPPVTVAFVVEQELAERGLATLANELGPFEETLLLDGRPGARGALHQGPDADEAARWPGLGRVTRWSLSVRYPGTPVETIALADADSLREALVHWIGGDQ
jgi:putative aminopeptidase FrvX